MLLLKKKEKQKTKFAFEDIKEIYITLFENESMMYGNGSK
jgi:hypothetical protein